MDYSSLPLPTEALGGKQSFQAPFRTQVEGAPGLSSQEAVVSNESEPLDKAAFDAILEAGERLLAALAKERRLSEAYPKDISRVFDYLESVSLARKTVDECAENYWAILAEYGFPDVPVRREIESGENRLRWRWPPRTT